MPSLAALLLATAALSEWPDRACARTPRLEIELELPPLLPSASPSALEAVTERVYATNGWFGIAIDGEVALLVDLRMDGPASRGAFSAAFGIALTR